MRRPEVEAVEGRILMSADADWLTLQSSFAGDAGRVSADLLLTYFRSPQGDSQLSGRPGNLSPEAVLALGAVLDDMSETTVPDLLSDPAGRVGLVITAVDPEALAPYLESLGMVVAAALPSYHRIEGYAPVSALPAISALSDKGLLGIEAVPTPKSFTGTVNSQADNVLQADRVRASAPGYNGAGVKIGVLSDSYNKYTASPASAGVSSGNLPNNVQVLQDYTSSATDEGRAMLELIYDLAPGAGLGFATANISESGFASNIRNLANAGYTIINDDVAYYDEPFFQDGIVAQAVDDVVTNKGVSYFSAAGNQGDLSYDSAATTAYNGAALSFVSQTISAISASASNYYDWNSGSGVDTLMSITIPRSSTVYLDFQWDQPYYTTSGVTTNLDFYLIRTSNNTVAASVTTNNVTNQTPYSLLTFTNSSSTSTAFNLVVRNTNGGPVPGRIKFVDFYGDSAVVYNEYFTRSATVVGHAAAAGAMAVGAAAFYTQTTPESFTSVGPSTILFNTNGTRKSSPEVRAKPDILAIDGTDTSFFYPGQDVDGNGFNNFFGTSAATPHAAAVAALLKQANPTWTNTQINARLKATADPTVGGVNVVGSGLIDAYRAIYGGPVAAAPVFSDGFESGALGTAWQVYKQGSGLTQVVSTNAPQSGTKQLVMGADLGYGTTGFTSITELNEAVLHLDLAGKTGVKLAFGEKEFTSETDDAMPASFTGHGNYDGVALSVDGTNWYRIVSLTGATSSILYKTLNYDLSAIAAGLGLTLGADTQVKFQQYNTSSFAIGTKGIAFDNVAVSAASTIAATTIDDGTAQRSRVRSVTVDFNGAVATAPSNAFTLTRTTDNVAVPVTASAPVPLAGGKTRVVLTFGGPTIEAGSLSDGRYKLSINGALILDDSARAVDADGNGADGGTRDVSFFRFFGDSNGDGLVDGVDYLAFNAAYKTGIATGIYAIYDADGNGLFTTADLNAFMLRFNKRKLP